MCTPWRITGHFRAALRQIERELFRILTTRGLFKGTACCCFVLEALEGYCYGLEVEKKNLARNIYFLYLVSCFYNLRVCYIERILSSLHKVNKIEEGRTLACPFSACRLFSLSANNGRDATCRSPLAWSLALCLLPRWVVSALSPGLINYIDTKANWPVKGLCGKCLSEFIDWRYSQSCWYFRPSFVNCFPFNLLSGSQEYGVPLGLLSQINTCREVPLQVNFFTWRHFALPPMSLIFLRVSASVRGKATSMCGLLASILFVYFIDVYNILYEREPTDAIFDKESKYCTVK